jgi:DNA-binding transcriptional ArsR family regulator
MLDALKASPLTTGALSGLFPELDRTTVLQHLRVLENAELVTGRKVGRERYLALAPLPIKRIHDRWISEYTRAAVDLLGRLDSDEHSVRMTPPFLERARAKLAARRAAGSAQ